MNHVHGSLLAAASPWWRPHPGSSLVVQGGRRLVGTYPISGAKNAVLPLMVSALVTHHLLTLHNVPASVDATVLSNLLHGRTADARRRFQRTMWIRLRTFGEPQRSDHGIF